MNADQPSRRSLLASLAGLAAWLLVQKATPAAKAATVVPDRVVRFADFPRSFQRDGPADRLTYRASGLPQGLTLDATTDLASGSFGSADKGAGETLRYSWSAPDFPASPQAVIHASCRLESVAGAPLGREEYEVVVEDGRRFVRVTTLDAAGAVVKSERLPF